MKPDNEKKEQFVAIYNAEADSIFRFCLLRTSERETALDLSQEAFLRFWNAYSEGTEAIQNPRALLFSIARHLIIDWYRKKKTISIEAMVEAGDEVEILLGVTERNTEVESDAKILIDRMKELDAIYREPVYLRFVEDLEPKEIAEIMGLSPNVVSVRITRGIKQLKDLYENGG